METSRQVAAKMGEVGFGPSKTTVWRGSATPMVQIQPFGQSSRGVTFWGSPRQWKVQASVGTMSARTPTKASNSASVGQIAGVVVALGVGSLGVSAVGLDVAVGGGVAVAVASLGALVGSGVGVVVAVGWPGRQEWQRRG